MKATTYPRLLFFILCFYVLTPVHTAAQQYQFTSNGSDGRDTVTTTRIVNSYAKVKAVSGNVVWTNGPYVPQTRDRVLLLQMTGRDSGVWQWDTVRVGGNPCYLSHIYKTFDTAGGAKIQMIKAPQYQSLYIRSTGVLTAAPWNDSTGGVLTFMVRDTFKMDSTGRCDVSYLGFLPNKDTTGLAAHGVGGAGGQGGAIGQNGGDSALVIGSGVGGGGDGGMFGQYGTAGDTIHYAHCPGCATPIYRDTATNQSLVDSGLALNKYIMGGAGRTGHGGKGGRGGGGGGGGTAGPGTNGGAGGHGGAGGQGGRGGGIILFATNYMAIPDSMPMFFALGENGYDGMPGDTGRAGGNGGPGWGPCTSGPGGGGRGASGGNGGDGGGGGGGGVVYAVRFHGRGGYSDQSYLASGGMRGRGGHGGPGGPGGSNGTILSTGGNCSGAQAGSGPNGDDGNDGNNGNNGTGAGGGNGGGGSTLVTTCQNFGNSYQFIPVGYGCTTQGYLPYFESTIYGGVRPYNIYGEDTLSGDYSTTYNMTVGDASGCLSTRVLVVSQPIFNPLYDITPSCPGMNNGTIMTFIDLTANFTAPPACVQPVGHTAIYDINGNFQDSSNAYFLSPGYYYVAWWINNDPIHYDTMEVEDVQPVTIIETLTQPTCSQPDGGSINLQPAIGGNACTLYNYVWSNQVNGLDNDNLTAGTYDLTVNYDGPSYCNQVPNVYYSTNYQCVQTFSYTLDPPVGSVDVYLDVDVCPGVPYTYNGIDYYAGLNMIPPANPGGCDTTVYLTVNEYYSPQGYEYQQICDGDQFYWNGNYYNQTGQYYATLYGSDMLGCDSTAMLDLNVLPPITAGNPADQTIGDGCATEPDYNAMSVSGGAGPYMFYSFVVGTPACNGNALVTSYLVEVDDAAGCIGNFYVDVNYVQDDYSITIDNTTPESCGAGDGTFSYTVANLSNQSCINPTWSLDITGVNTSSQTGISSSSAYQSSTEYNYSADTYNYVLSGLGSCITPVTGSFYIYSSIAGVTSYTYDTICNNSAVTWNGTTYTQTGVYSYLMTGGSAGGCDSTAYLDLYIAPTYSTAWYDTISVGQSVTLGGQQYNAGGVYTATLTSVSGCDSIVMLYLTVQQLVPPVTTYLTENICAGATYTVGIHSYGSAGSFIDTLAAQQGQDSIIYLTLTVTQPVTSAATVSICSGSSYTWGGNSYTTAGTYTHTFTAANGCDSIVTLTLSVTQPVTSAATGSICSGSSYTWAGNSYTTAGIYTHTFTAASGCDSIVTLTLSVTQPVTSATTASICSGSSYTWGGNSYTTAGIYTHTFTAASGCDSIVTLTLSVTQSVATTLADTICQGEAYTVGHNTYTATGTYTDIFTGASGCDSVQTLQLVVLQSATPSLVITVSHGPVINGQQIDTFRADYTACDGAFYSWYLNLVPQGLHDSIAVISHFVNQADSIVCRIDCQNRCASTTYTYSNRIMSGINNPASFLHSVGVYPNPNAGAFTLEVNSDIATTAQLSLLDVIGQNVLADQMPLRTGDNKRQIQLPESAASGVYILQLLVEGHTLYQRVTVER